jgi:hypothetical protein
MSTKAKKNAQKWLRILKNEFLALFEIFDFSPADSWTLMHIEIGAEAGRSKN